MYSTQTSFPGKKNKIKQSKNSTKKPQNNKQKKPQNHPPHGELVWGILIMGSLHIIYNIIWWEESICGLHLQSLIVFTQKASNYCNIL